MFVSELELDWEACFVLVDAAVSFFGLPFDRAASEVGKRDPTSINI